MKKAVVSKTSPEAIEHQVNFEPRRFNALVFDKGYDVYVDKAYKCPCAVKNAGQPLINCHNCLGLGWLFSNRVETNVVVQGLNVDIKYENWTKTTAGTARITARAIDRLAFMDRITLRDVEGYHNEILRSKKIDGIVYFFTNYELTEIEDIMLFKGNTVPLDYLEEGADYTLDPEKPYQIKMNSQYNTLIEEIVVTIRYRHLQTYHILDMNRDILKVKTKGCNKPEQELAEMPISGVARKAHYMFDNQKYEETKNLIDNTKLL